MKIERPHSSAIIFRKSRKGSCAFVLILSAAIIAWEWLVWGRPTSLIQSSFLTNSSINFPRAVVYILAALPLLGAPFILRRLSVAIFGRAIALDGLSRTITRNNRFLANFEDVERFDFRKRDRSAVRLKLLLNSGKRVTIGKLRDTGEFERIKTDVGRMFERTGLFEKEDRSEKTAPSPSTSGAYLIFSMMFFFVRGFSVFLLLCSVLLPISNTMHLTDRVKFQGNMWVGSIFLLLFGVLLYGVSWFLGYLRLLWKE